MSSTRRSLLADMSNSPCAGKTLDKLIQPAILTVLAREALHGYRVVQRIAEMPTLGGCQPDAAGVYRFLRSMEKRGLVVSSWDVSGAGPAKRSYRITEAGRTCLANWVQTLEDYRTAIGGLLARARKARGQPRRTCRAERRQRKGPRTPRGTRRAGQSQRARP